MPDFKHGKLTDFLLNQYNLTRFFKALRTKGEVDLLDGTTFRAEGKEYGTGFRDGEVSGEGLFKATDPLIADADQVLNAAVGAAIQPVGTLSPAGLDVLGNACKLFKGDVQNKDLTANIQELTMISFTALVSEGIRAGKVLAPIASYSSTGNGSSVDNAAATTNGAVAHLHVLSKTGTTPTIDWKVQHSVDNSVWADLFTFTQATDKTFERLTVTGTINRYLRAIRTVGGTDSPAFECALAVARL